MPLFMGLVSACHQPGAHRVQLLNGFRKGGSIAQSLHLPKIRMLTLTGAQIEKSSDKGAVVTTSHAALNAGPHGQRAIL